MKRNPCQQTRFSRKVDNKIYDSLIGDPKQVIDCCDSIFDLKEGKKIAMTQSLYENLEEILYSIQLDGGLKSVAFAFKEINTDVPLSESRKGKFSLIGVFGNIIQPKQQAKNTLSLIKESGMKVIHVNNKSKSKNESFFKKAKLISDQIQFISNSASQKILGNAL